MKQVTFILVLLMAALLVTPVAAVTYIEEYYNMGNDSVYRISQQLHADTNWNWELGTTVATWLELRRQTILMEKQNELLEEQNGLMRMQMGMKLKCKVAGIASGAFCDEYTWVAK